jgi:hypothetical protein
MQSNRITGRMRGYYRASGLQADVMSVGGTLRRPWRNPASIRAAQIGVRVYRELTRYGRSRFISLFM